MIKYRPSKPQKEPHTRATKSNGAKVRRSALICWSVKKDGILNINLIHVKCVTIFFLQIFYLILIANEIEPQALCRVILPQRTTQCSYLKNSKKWPLSSKRKQKIGLKLNLCCVRSSTNLNIKKSPTLKIIFCQIC